jgi:hypothetical protein
MDNKNLYTLAFLYTGNVLVLYSTSLAMAVKIRSKMNILHSPHQVLFGLPSILGKPMQKPAKTRKPVLRVQVW